MTLKIERENEAISCLHPSELSQLSRLTFFSPQRLTLAKEIPPFVDSQSSLGLS